MLRCATRDVKMNNKLLGNTLCTSVLVRRLFYNIGYSFDAKLSFFPLRINKNKYSFWLCSQGKINAKTKQQQNEGGKSRTTRDFLIFMLRFGCMRLFIFWVEIIYGHTNTQLGLFSFFVGLMWIFVFSAFYSLFAMGYPLYPL